MKKCKKCAKKCACMCMCMYIWPHVCINVFVGVRARDAEKTLLGFRIIMPTLATRRQPGDRRSIFFFNAEDLCAVHIYMCVCVFVALKCFYYCFLISLLIYCLNPPVSRLCACALVSCWFVIILHIDFFHLEFLSHWHAVS